MFLISQFSAEAGESGWRRSAHARARYPRQSLLAPGFNPSIAREEGRVQRLHYTSCIAKQFKTIHPRIPSPNQARYYTKNGRLIPTAKRGNEIKQP